MMVSTNGIYIAQQDTGNLVVVAPPYGVLMNLFLIAGVLCWLAGPVLSLVLRGKGGTSRSLFAIAFPLFLAIVIGTPFLFVGFHTARTTRVTLSAGEHRLKVQESLLSIPIATRSYPLANIERTVTGVGENCASLRAVMKDGGSVPLLGCTDRPGYNEAVEQINEFLQRYRAGMRP